MTSVAYSNGLFILFRDGSENADFYSGENHGLYNGYIYETTRDSQSRQQHQLRFHCGSLQLRPPPNTPEVEAWHGGIDTVTGICDHGRHIKLLNYR